MLFVCLGTGPTTWEITKQINRLKKERKIPLDLEVYYRYSSVLSFASKIVTPVTFTQTDQK